MGSLTLKRHSSFQNQNNGKATTSFALRRLVFKLQQEVLKFTDICVSWSSPKLTWGQKNSSLISGNRPGENFFITHPYA